MLDQSVHISVQQGHMCDEPFQDGGRYHIETMITASVLKGLICRPVFLDMISVDLQTVSQFRPVPLFSFNVETILQEHKSFPFFQFTFAN